MTSLYPLGLEFTLRLEMRGEMNSCTLLNLEGAFFPVSLLFLFSFSAFFSCTASDFTPPGEKERLRAIGSTKKLSEILRRAFDPGADFNPIPAPGPGDWLAEHREEGQTFESFAKANWNRPDKTRNKICLQPLGDFPKDRSPSLDALKEFASAFFAMEVKVLPVLSLSGRDLTTRINPFTQKRQVLTGDVLHLLKGKLPPDAFCFQAITMEDLYPDPSWNFVFGQASLRDRVGVFSFARYDPLFYGEKREADHEEVLLRRSCKVLAHEAGHMFGMHHCIFFSCLMNGSNHLQESDSRPLRLCPVCLRKLHSTMVFDVAERYGRLLNFFRTAGFQEDAQWMERRIERISGRE